MTIYRPTVAQEMGGDHSINKASPLMYLYDRYQFVTYITVGLAVFIFAFIITFIFVKTDKATKEA